MDKALSQLSCASTPDTLHQFNNEYGTPEKAALQRAVHTNKARKPSKRVSKQHIFDELGYKKTAAYRHLQESTSRRTSKFNRPGRSTVLAEQVTKSTLDWITFNFTRRAMTYLQVIREHNITHSRQPVHLKEIPSTTKTTSAVESQLIRSRTLKRALEKHGYQRCRACWARYLKPHVPKARQAFANAHRTWDLEWLRVHFSDKTHFAVGYENHYWVTRSHDERHEPDCMQYKSQRNPTTLHFWAAVGYNFKTELYLYWDEEGAGNLDMDTYIKILEECYLPELRWHQSRWRKVQWAQGGFFLEEDGDSAHGHASKNNKVTKFMKAQGIQCYKNCPYSPDFSIIETVWRYLKQRVRMHRARTKEELLSWIYYEWSHITQDYINGLVGEMEDRIYACLDAKGKATQY